LEDILDPALEISRNAEHDIAAGLKVALFESCHIRAADPDPTGQVRL
jgi:hypothetical protein